MDHKKTAKEVWSAVGGNENVNSVIHCVTRLRFKLKDNQFPDKEKIKQIDGVITVVESGGQFQVVIGNEVPKVYEALLDIMGVKHGDQMVEEDQKNEKASLFSRFVDVISGVFMPVVGVLAAVGILKGLLALCTSLGWMTDQMGTYKILYATADAMFYFFPVILGFSAGKKFGGNPYLSAVLGAAMVYPTITSAFTDKTALSFLTIPVVLINYTSSVIPIIIGAFLAAKVEKMISKFAPASIKMFMVPFLTLVIISPLVFLVVGPIATIISDGLAKGSMWIYQLSPAVAGLVLAGFWQGIIIFGLHWAFIPILLNNVVTNGFDPINGMLFCTTFAQTGAAFAIALKSRDPKLKPIATSATIAGLMGVTEPAIYGVTLPAKKPFILASIAGGIGGAAAGLLGSTAYGFASGGIFGIPLFINPKGMDAGFIGFIISLVVAFVVAFILTYLFGYKNAKPASEIKIADENKEEEKAVFSPLHGELIPLTTVKDEAFSSGAMGQGAAIIPKEGVAYAPFNGTVVTVFKTKHAIGLISEDGVELLIHIGINTVSLKGKHFTSFVSEGDTIQKGDKLVEFDPKAIGDEGYDITTSVIVTNTAVYTDILVEDPKDIHAGDRLLKIR
ncbi:beta-glucoside-specific PTS transporter subunit IIABC [Paenibacillus polymyxa]|uniref:Beta-glucoside-specific PTS transporter subunit IIABC n=1 Tax=Paenibacillus polymyxa TaxID=1406 RepID=A0AAE9IHN8_PAEPO|nr:beta-glucoside-specific PTS transporter subunit IIABC [Paenibacillus polymyxa]URJ53192.1 beta-glucoside-specific PTS transporter subunit IIABC [Paenibacillus polymyxa]